MKKTRLLTVKFESQTVDDFATVARLKKTTMSALVYQFVLQAIREQKDATPEAFSDYVQPFADNWMVDSPEEVVKAIYERYEKGDVPEADMEKFVAFITRLGGEIKSMLAKAAAEKVNIRLKP
ncbi:MAG: hypothetical protein QM785_12345 [Pyrinomonadaceae bacterium]